MDRFSKPAEFIADVNAKLKRHGITQAKLAAAAGKTRPEVNRWLRGRRRPSLRNMIALDAALSGLLGLR